MGQLFADAARAYLSAGINNTDTTISIAAGGALFPVANGTDWFKAVLQDSSGIEIVYVTAHTSGTNTFTVTRGQEGTTARSFASGAVFGVRVTSADMAGFAAKLSDAPSDGKQYARKNAAWAEVVAGGGGSEDATTSFTYTYTGVMGMPPIPLPGSGSLFASPAGNERAFNVLFAGTANPNLTGIEFTKLEFIGSNFNPNNMATLTTLSMPALTTVGGIFQPSSMAALTSLSLPALTAVGGNFQPNNLAALTSLSLPALTTVGGAFSPFDMAALTTLSLPALTTVGGTFSPYSMAALTSLSLPALTTVGSTFSLNSMATLTTLSMPALTTVGGIFQPSSMAALTSLSLPALTAVGGNFQPNNLAALTSLSLPALTTVGGTFSLNSMATLTSLSMPAIERIGTSITSGNAIQLSNATGALTTFTLPATLKQVGGTAGNVTITSAALDQSSVDNILVRLAALDGTGGTVGFSNRTVTITGTSAAPSSTGLAAKATLVARGCTVTHN